MPTMKQPAANQARCEVATQIAMPRALHAAAATIARFATQVDRSGASAFLAGDAGSADGTGAVGVVRADTAATTILSTVDNVHTPAGRVVTVLALREQLEGEAGRYGDAGNAERPAPGAPQE